MRIFKFIIGIRFNEKMFRFSSLNGQVIDKILALRTSDKRIGKDYFSQLAANPGFDDFKVNFFNEDSTHVLTIASEQIIFTKKVSGETDSVSVKQSIEEFGLIWREANSILEFPGARRIGLVAEHRFPEKDASGKDLLQAFTPISPPKFSGHFNLSYEERRLTKDEKTLDPKNSDFINIIRNYHSSDIDKDDPEDGKINANIDVQRYFNPPCKSVPKEINELRKLFLSERDAFVHDLVEKG